MRFIKKLLSIESSLLVACLLPLLVGFMTVGDARGSCGSPKMVGSNYTYLTLLGCYDIYVIDPNTDAVNQWADGYGFKIPDTTCCAYWTCACSGTACEQNEVLIGCGVISSYTLTQHTSHGCSTSGDWPYIKAWGQASSSCCNHGSGLWEIWQFSTMMSC